MLRLMFKQCCVEQDGLVLQCMSSCCLKQRGERYRFDLGCIDAQGAT